MEGNLAWYPGSGNLTVCQRVYDYTLLKYVSSSCGVNAAGGPETVRSHYGDLMAGMVQNDSTVNAHTVEGDWYSRF
jgi:hypothetical protein